MRAFFLALSAFLLAGCETLAYYGQAAVGQLSLISRAQPVELLLADPAADRTLKERLALASEMRDFATRELHLPDNGSYRSYAELGRPYALWNVVAAPEFSLAPLQSCFPVAGCVSYRGYYDRAAAARYASGLRAAGNDVVVFGVPAYSTLGWFDDPLLSTFIDYPEGELARLIFHELAHQLVYVKDDSTFNESFAVAVEREGLRRWLARQGRAAPPARKDEFVALIEETRKKLEALYRARLAPEAMREKKHAALEGLRPWLAVLKGLEGQEPNNALLAAYATYTELVPAFEKLLAQAGGDLPAFYARVEALAALDPAQRKSALAGLSAQNGGPGSPSALLSAPSTPDPSPALRR
jgi:predicted aminopeptidase